MLIDSKMRDNEKTSKQYKREVLGFAIPQFRGIVFSSNRKSSYGQSQLDHSMHHKPIKIQRNDT